jgi:hypothetical protein
MNVVDDDLELLLLAFFDVVRDLQPLSGTGVPLSKIAPGYFLITYHLQFQGRLVEPLLNLSNDLSLSLSDSFCPYRSLLWARAESCQQTSKDMDRERSGP